MRPSRKAGKPYTPKSAVPPGIHWWRRGNPAPGVFPPDWCQKPLGRCAFMIGWGMAVGSVAGGVVEVVVPPIFMCPCHCGRCLLLAYCRGECAEGDDVRSRPSLGLAT